MTVLALTPGCPNGIGPEIAPLALAHAKLRPSTSIVWCERPSLFERHAKAYGISFHRRENTIILDTPVGALAIECTLPESTPALDTLSSQKNSLLKAIELAKQKKVDAIVTGPIRKKALQDIDRRSFPGQTELLHFHLKADDRPPLMCFAGGSFLLGLATIHVPIKDVASQITPALLKEKIARLQEACRLFYQTDKTHSRISVLGLNPHAGEDGLIGDEEQTILIPTLNKLKQQGFCIKGPLPADGFWGHVQKMSPGEQPHAVLAMMHDQGLGPYKLLCQGHVANITLGLTIPRTSPAHGTADDIAGLYKADPASMIKALQVAEALAIQLLC